ncbi:Hypp9664 [Branchiostoma lanceolatum]|uniref:Hypp9664 protein n=1 Tax=Branchiostoma lanceolatum TaxID=7740 RepID=A0A8S4MP58_BRALA|nr:Hypp9664 [Branchiostoma lanceolatum]
MESEEDTIWLLPPEKRTRTSVATSKIPSCSVSAAPPVSVCRSQTISFDFSKCIFCQKQTHKKVKDLINVSTFEACQRIVEAARVKEDEELLRILGGVNNDLIAAEGKYHKACQASYTSKSNLKVVSSKVISDGFSLAFRDLLDAVQPHLDSGQAFTMSSLLDRYKTCLEKRHVDSTSYTTYHLKAKLQGHFGESIAFHIPYDRSMSELVYSSSVSLQDVLHAAYRTPTAVPTTTDDAQRSKSAQATEDTDKDMLLYHAAIVIKSDINNARGIQTQPISVSDMTLATCNSGQLPGQQLAQGSCPAGTSGQLPGQQLAQGSCPAGTSGQLPGRYLRAVARLVPQGSCPAETSGQLPGRYLRAVARPVPQGSCPGVAQGSCPSGSTGQLPGW